MNYKFLVFLAVAGLVVGGFAGFALHGNKLGATVNYSNCGGSINCYNGLASIVQDVQAVRAPLAGMLTGSASFGPGILGIVGASTSTASTTVTVTGAVAGDFVLVQGQVAVASLAVVGVVSATNTVQVAVSNLSAATQTPATTTYNVIVLPRASFVAPAALVTTTSTSN